VGDPWRWVIAGAAVVTAGCAAFAIAAAVSSDDGSDTSTQTTGGESVAGEPVEIVDFSFDPADLTVDVGASVTWTNDDSTTHSVVGAGGAFASPDIAPGTNFSTTFNQVGTFEYVCGIHPSMTGTVTVQE
jgi:plastocyanin